MKSVLVDKGIAEDKIVSLGIFDIWFQITKKDGLSKGQPIIVAGNFSPGKSWLLLCSSCTRLQPLWCWLWWYRAQRWDLLGPFLPDEPCCSWGWFLTLSGMGIVRKPVMVFLAKVPSQQLSQGIALSSIGLPACSVETVSFISLLWRRLWDCSRVVPWLTSTIFQMPITKIWVYAKRKLAEIRDGHYLKTAWIIIIRSKEVRRDFFCFSKYH